MKPCVEVLRDEQAAVGDDPFALEAGGDLLHAFAARDHGDGGMGEGAGLREVDPQQHRHHGDE